MKRYELAQRGLGQSPGAKASESTWWAFSRDPRMFLKIVLPLKTCKSGRAMVPQLPCLWFQPTNHRAPTQSAECRRDADGKQRKKRYRSTEQTAGFPISAVPGGTTRAYLLRGGCGRLLGPERSRLAASIVVIFSETLTSAVLRRQQLVTSSSHADASRLLLLLLSRLRQITTELRR